ncbi:MAG: hypothetical protein VX589_01205 [Myxococcota bacterium]|nr:hypothetical protein [Myxococcota bacterium]
MRKLFVALYYGLCACFVILVAYGATYGAFFDQTSEVVDSNNGSAPVKTAITLSTCNAKLSTLRAKLDTHATAHFGQLLKAGSQDKWSTWSAEFRRELETLRRRCKILPADQRPAFAQRRKGLARLHVAIDNAFDSFGRRGRKAVDAIEIR